MIPISLTTAFALYSVVIGLGALTIWFYMEFRVRHTYKVLEKQYLWRCVFCAFSYLDEANNILSQCPRCGSFNALDDKHARVIKAAVPPTPAQHEKMSDPPRRNPSRKKRPRMRRRGPRHSR